MSCLFSLQNFCVLWACLAKPIKKIVSTGRNLWCLSAKNQLHHLRYFILFFFEYFRHGHQIWYYQLAENFDVYLHKSSTSSLTSSLRYCKDFAKLLFWVRWAWLTMSTKNDSLDLYGNLMFISKQKIKFITIFFLQIFQRYCKLVILGTFGMSVNSQQKRWYYITENFDDYLHTKNQIYHSPLF